MLDLTHAEDALGKARAHAHAVDLGAQLEDRLTYLAEYAGGKNTCCRLYPDRAPYSFEFVMQKSVGDQWITWFTGGLIYHGPHDGHGSGSAPTFAVTLEAMHGWSIHT